MKNIQIFDGADNATFSVFQVTDEEFAQIFPGPGQDIEFIEDLVERLGDAETGVLMSSVWARPILKRDIHGLHGTLFYEFESKKKYFPATKREVDIDPSFVNAAQRELFEKHR